jgi:pyruvate dehydrogenase E2 component (dihydrolipoamide acetyltransferase)
MDVVMPQMGESIVEGTLTKWLKKPGDTVERDEPLFEISTDKVDTVIPSPAAGILGELLVKEGETVGVGTIVARIGDGAAAAAPTAPAPAIEAPATPPPPPPAAAPAAPAAPAPVAAAPVVEAAVAEPAGPLSPLVRKMARESNIDLAKVTGSGAGGRITKEDVEKHIAGASAPVPATTPPVVAAPAVTAPVVAAPAATAPVVAAPAATAPVAAAPAATAPVAPRSPIEPTAKTRVEPLSIMRKAIAEHMVRSKHTAPHVTTIHKVDMTKVAKIRARNKASFQAQYGMSLTFLPFVTQATVEALRAFPIVNASIEGSNIIYHNEINIGIAVALENGLIVPVIRNADEKNVVGLQRSIVDLASRARARQLKPDEIQGGTFSISNFGGFGSIIATPVINQPQSAILGVGAIEKTPVVVDDDAIAIRSIMYLSLSFDHRLIDGAVADQFTAKIKAVLENFSEDIL